MRNATRLGPLVFLVGVIVSVGCGKLKPSTIDGSPDAAVDGTSDAAIDSANDSGVIDSADAASPSDGGLADGPDADARKDAAACLGFADVGCFTGEVCASPRVEAVCVDGAWRCPAGSHVTESCFDAGLTCSVPGVPAIPLENVCAMTGKTSVDPNGCCPQPSTNWDTDVSLLPALPSESDVPPCSRDEEPAAPPGWQLKVEKVLPPQPHPNSDHYDTRIVTTRVGNGATCSVTIAVVLRAESMVLPVGSTIQYTRKSVLSETDGSVSTAIRDSNGKLLVGWVGDIRPEAWDADVLPELKVALTPVCDRGTGDSALNVSVSSGTDTCSADDGTARCCSLGGETFQMEVPAARRYRGTAPSDRVTMLIAKSGVIVPAR